MKISWTPTARKSYFYVLEYLEQSWTEKELYNFIIEVEKLLTQIAENPEMFQESSKKKNIRKGFITKHNALYYRVKPRKKELQLLVFWDNRQNPEKLDY
jgi:plasmid stabilization system protein ParE